MHITYLSYSKIPSREANSIQVVKMCGAFTGLGHRVTLFAVNGAEQDTNIEEFYGVTDGFKVVKISLLKIPGLRQLWYTCAVISNLIKQPKPDAFYGRDAIYSLSAAALFGSPVILEVHKPPHNNVERWFIRWLSKRSDFFRLVAISKSLITYYQELLPELDQEKFLVAQDGADPVDVERLPRLPSLGREGVLQVGYSGHLYEGRGIEVICSLADCMPQVDFHIVGGQDEHIRKWRERCGSSNLYFHGFIAPKEVPSFLNQFDILLAPYQKKVSVSGNIGNTAPWMSPLKIFEYMSVGKAIICSDLPALREFLTPEVDCLMVKPDDPQAWAQAIVRLSEQDYREVIGRAAQANFNRQFTWRKRAESVLRGLQKADLGSNG